MPDSSTTINWGILPCSRVARQRWIPAIQSLPDARIAAIASRDLKKAQNWADEFNITHNYDNYQALLQDDRVNAIFIGLPNSLHLEWTLAALEAGKHVLCDKPLGITARQAETMVNAAHQQNRLLTEGFMYHFHDQYTLIHQWLAEGAIGNIRHIAISFNFVLADPQNIRFNPELGGGALLDLGCYCVHAIRTLSGMEPLSVQARQYLGPTGVDLRTAAVLELPDGITASFDCAIDHAGGRQLVIGGDQGRIFSAQPFTAKEAALVTLHRGDQLEQHSIQPVNMYAACVQHFQAHIRNGRPTDTMNGDSANNLRVLDAITQAARNN